MMLSLQQTYAEINQAALEAKRDPNIITLIAVSKTKSIESILAAVNSGQKHFGENYVQEALTKIQALKDQELTWHYLGKIQSNKIKDIVSNFTCVHSVDSLKHAEALSRECQAQNKMMPIFLQVNFENEAGKGGFTKTELEAVIKKISLLENIKLLGLMLIPAPKAKAAQRQTFAKFRTYRDALVKTFEVTLPELSMGMSDDFVEAILEGATYIRIGTKIFGAR